MRTIYLDCGMGCAGDMLAGALLELLPDRQAFVNAFNKVGIPGVEMRADDSEKCGVRGVHVTMVIDGEVEDEHMHDHTYEHDHDHDHEHSHDHDHDHEHEHSHDHDHDHDHEHSHDHDHDHEHEHSHDHDHDHDHDHEHHHAYSHTGMEDIRKLIRSLDLPQNIKKDITAVYEELAAAESEAHGVEVSEIHFHEVGMMDAIADVTAVCMLMDWIQPDEVLASPVNVGSGRVRCAHGILPVPAPATAALLKGIPSYQDSMIKGELTTPTGAALLRHFVSKFCSMPVMTTLATGYGMGTKDFEVANCVRAFAGKTNLGKEGHIVQLSCNVDDMTGEEMAFAIENLLSGGAVDAWLTPIVMKKSRLATKIEVLCKEADKDEIVSLLFKYTTTLGVRECGMKRYELLRNERTIKTPAGNARVKESMGFGVNRKKIEYDDAVEIARKYSISLKEARELIDRGDNA